jgi:glyoxylase-like metal-dependent hydrolase (beta-lactamase superfamily II)
MRHGQWLIGLCLLAATPAMAQDKYPQELVAPGKGPYSFPDGYRTDFSKVEMMVTAKLAPNLYIVHGNAGVDTAHPDGSGGRMAVLFGPDGVLLVDSQNKQVGEKSLKAIRSFTQAPIRILVNSHPHSDHTGANVFFAHQGALIFGQDNLRKELAEPPPRPNGQPGEAMEPDGLPVVTYPYDPAKKGQPAVTITMDGETVDFIPMMPSHTGGDTIVRFNKANVIYIEDFYRNFGYPYAAQDLGGSIKGMLEAVDLLETIADDKTLLVPGHGTMVHKKDLLGYRAMLVDIIAKVSRMRDAGASLKDVLAANLTAPYDKSVQGDTPQSRDRFLSEVYYEVKDFPPLVDGKRTMPKP